MLVTTERNQLAEDRLENKSTFCKLIGYGFRRRGHVREDVMFHGLFEETVQDIAVGQGVEGQGFWFQTHSI